MKCAFLPFEFSNLVMFKMIDFYINSCKLIQSFYLTRHVITADEN